MEFTMAMAVALVGSVATVCLSILKIAGSKKESEPSHLPKLEEKVAVQEVQIKDIRSDLERLQDNLEKLNDLLLKLLTER